MEVSYLARRHGVPDSEIRHAWLHALGFFVLDIEQESIKGLCIGPDTAGNLLEVLYLEFEDGHVIIHAMPLRPKFSVYLTGRTL